MVTSAQVKKFAPGANPALVAAIVGDWPAAIAAGISTDLRIAHFFAQIATETGGLKSVEESLNYSVEALLEKFGRHRISEADARKYGRTRNRKADQKAIANIVYGGAWGRKNLGNTEPNDGWDFRGGGMMQTTGRANYRKMGHEDSPNALRDPTTAFLTAVHEWSNRGCNALADRDDVTAIRKVINGGTNGLTEAKTYLVRAKAVFTSSAPQKAALSNKTDLVKQVQDLLWDKGYPEVGESDGKFGSRTRNAILAFQADNKLDLTGEISDALLASLVKTPKRQMASSRQSATAASLISEPVVKDGNWIKKIGTGVLTASGIGGVLDGTGSIDSAVSGISSLRAFVETVSPFLPWIIVGAAGVAVFLIGRRVVRTQVEAYREGRTF